MEAKDLRIGNLILCKELFDDYSYRKVDEHIIVVDAVTLRLGDFENKLIPIPLTEEWLVSCGFKRDEYSLFVKEGFLFSLEFNQHNPVILSVMDYRSRPNKITSLSFVHQLQNLFFALTGEELTIKEGGEK